MNSTGRGYEWGHGEKGGEDETIEILSHVKERVRLFDFRS